MIRKICFIIVIVLIVFSGYMISYKTINILIRNTDCEPPTCIINNMIDDINQLDYLLDDYERNINDSIFYMNKASEDLYKLIDKIDKNKSDGSTDVESHSID